MHKHDFCGELSIYPRAILANKKICMHDFFFVGGHLEGHREFVGGTCPPPPPQAPRSYARVCVCVCVCVRACVYVCVVPSLSFIFLLFSQKVVCMCVYIWRGGGGGGGCSPLAIIPFHWPRWLFLKSKSCSSQHRQGMLPIECKLWTECATLKCIRLLTASASHAPIHTSIQPATKKSQCQWRAWIVNPC